MTTRTEPLNTAASTSPPILVGTTPFALAVRAAALAAGTPENHPVLTSPTFNRRVTALITSGRIPCEYVNVRMRIDPAHAPRAAMLLGLIAPPAVAA